MIRMSNHCLRQQAIKYLLLESILSNSPHVNMFYKLIKELEAEDHEIIITSRPLANTIALLDQKGLKHTVVGGYYGKSIYKKIIGYPIRIFQLIHFLKNQKIFL